MRFQKLLQACQMRPFPCEIQTHGLKLNSHVKDIVYSMASQVLISIRRRPWSQSGTQAASVWLDHDSPSMRPVEHWNSQPASSLHPQAQTGTDRSATAHIARSGAHTAGTRSLTPEATLENERETGTPETDDLQCVCRHRCSLAT